jgi:hypothetical protein
MELLMNPFKAYLVSKIFCRGDTSTHRVALGDLREHAKDHFKDNRKILVDDEKLETACRNLGLDWKKMTFPWNQINHAGFRTDIYILGIKLMEYKDNDDDDDLDDDDIAEDDAPMTYKQQRQILLV